MTCARNCTGSASARSGSSNQTTRRATASSSGVTGKVEGTPVDRYPGCEHLLKIDSVANKRININVVSGLAALLHYKRLAAGDIEQRRDMHL
jgi:hypothetical protein